MPRARYYVDHVVLWWYGVVVSVKKCCRALELRIRRRSLGIVIQNHLHRIHFVRSVSEQKMHMLY